MHKIRSQSDAIKLGEIIFSKGYKLMATRHTFISKKSITIILFVITVVFLSSCSGGNLGKGNGPVQSLDEAIEIVVNEVVQPDKLDHPLIVFLLPEPLHPGDKIGPYNKSGFEPHKDPTEITEDTWFFWIDDAPGAEFVHSSRFVLISQESGQITVSEEVWWPVLNGEGLWTTKEDYWDETQWAFKFHEPRLAENSFLSTSHLASSVFQVNADLDNSGAAIVINGWEAGESGEENFENNSSGMHDALDNSGFDVTYYGPPQDDNPDRDGESTADNRVNWFSDKANELKFGDTLVVFISGHGFVDRNGLGWVGDIREDWLKKDLEKFDPGVEIVVVINGCYTGSFVDSLSKVADITITATGAYDPSYGDLEGLFYDDPNPEDKGSEFVSGFVEGWNKVMSDEKLQEEARNRAEKSGTSFWEEVSSLAYITALDLDAAYREGMTFPQAVRGGLGTRPGPSATPAATATPEPSPTASALSALGEFFSAVTVKIDKAKHKNFIGMPGKITLTIKAGSIRIEGPFPWVTVIGEINSDGSFEASGKGTVAGFPNIKVTFMGSVTGDHLEGDYTMGANGGLPDAQPIVYGINGEKVRPEETATPDPLIGEIQNFFNSYNENFQAADINGLFEMLHPAVLEIYGVDACQVYLAGIINNPIEVTFIEVISFEPWLWEIDDHSTLIEDAYSILASITTPTQTVESSLHLGLLGDKRITWFTDCGDPLP